MTYDYTARADRIPTWLRFIVLFSLFMIVGFRRELLGGLGYADAGWARWIFATVMATAYMAFVVLTSRDALWQAIADGPRIIRLGYTALFILAALSALLFAFADRAFSNPFFWLSMCALLLVSVLEWRVRRSHAQV